MKYLSKTVFSLDDDSASDDKQDDADKETTTEETADDTEEGSNKKKKAKKKDKVKKKFSLDNFIALIEDGWEKITLIYELFEEDLKKLFSKIGMRDIKLDLVSANEDAYDAALLYGKMSAVVYNALGWCCSLFKVRLSTVGISIDCLYNTPKEFTKYDGECVVTLRPASLINAVGSIAFKLVSKKAKYAFIWDLIDKNNNKTRKDK